MLLAKPGEKWYMGLTPFGFVRFREVVTWEMLKDAARDSPTLPLYHGHPRRPEW